MSDPNQKSSKELAAVLGESMPEIKIAFTSWLANPSTRYPAQKIYEIAELVLAQQREIEQLKAELKEVQRELMNRERK